MKKTEIKVLDYATEIMQALNKGILLSTKDGEKSDVMAISWGSLQIEWNKKLFTTFIRQSRYTKELLDNTGEFTISIPTKNHYSKNIINTAGTTTGRETDKFRDLNLTKVPPEVISVPGLLEFPITLECKVIYKQKQDLQAISPENQAFYPQNVDSSFPGANKDVAIAYYGEIVRAYFIE